MREAGEKIAMLTCYDASFAALLDRAGVDVMLIGDSLGNVLQGHSDHAARHARRHRVSHGVAWRAAARAR